MSLAPWKRTVTNDNGDIVPNADVEGVNASSSTLTKVGAGVTTLRFSGSTDLSFGVHLMPDGGESAT